jgi:Cu/Ag efflux pump CusA
VIGEATRGARRPLVYATAIALIAVVPIVVMEGRPGAFLEPLVLGYVLALVAAMVVAATVTPALSLLLLSWGTPRFRESPVIHRLRPAYGGALARFMRSSKPALLTVAVLAVGGVALLPLLGTSVVPSFKDRDVVVRLASKPGTSNPAMTAVATSLSRDLRAVPGVDNVAAHVGRAVTGDQRVDVNSSEVWVLIAAIADYRDVMTYSARKVSDVGALNSGANEVGGDGIDVLTGAGAPIVTRVYGNDLGVLQRKANEIRRRMAGVQGVVNPRVRRPQEQPNLVIEVDLEKAQRFGVKPGDVRRRRRRGDLGYPCHGRGRPQPDHRPAGRRARAARPGGRRADRADPRRHLA